MWVIGSFAAWLLSVQDPGEQTPHPDRGQARTCRPEILLIALCGRYGVTETQDLLARFECLLPGIAGLPINVLDLLPELFNLGVQIGANIRHRIVPRSSVCREPLSLR